MTIKYKNNYGQLELELVSEYIPVSTIKGSNISDSLKFSLETAEQIALITENRKIQICIPLDWKVYVIIHNSPSTAAIAKIKSLDFIADITPAEELHRLNKGKCIY